MEKERSGSSEQDNYVIFLQPNKSLPKASQAIHSFLKKEHRNQKWLLMYGVTLALCMAAFSVLTVYRLIMSCPEDGQDKTGLTTVTSDQNTHSYFFWQVNKDKDFEVDVIQVVIGPEPEGSDQTGKTIDPSLPKTDNDGDLPSSSHLVNQQGNCTITDVGSRFDCLIGEMEGSQNQCFIRGCCWDEHVPQGVPYCYYPLDFPSYYVVNKQMTNTGFRVNMTRNTPSKWPGDVKTLSADVMFETESRLRLRIYDPAHTRYEVPISTPQVKTGVKNPNYNVSVPLTGHTFTISVTRKGSQATLFDTSRGVPLIFSDQYIQVSTQLGSKYVYGLGEHRGPFLHSLNWTKLAFWARDQAPEPHLNLYGNHPFFMGFDRDGLAYGVFLLNSNAMQVNLQPMPAITYRTIGGILDFYIFTGPSPNDVLRQYTDVIGRSILPPYWSLGFHLCKYGYGSADELKKVIARMRASKIPYDTQWSDIDYMDRHLDWTYDHNKYADLPNIVQDLHDHDQHYIMIVDPGISSTQPNGTYPPYDEGLKEGVFVQNADGSGPLIGKVWPGETAFPDFFNPATEDWWFRQAQRYHSMVPFDGMWIDMNEPSNFVDGSTEGCPGGSTLEYPPWTPGIDGGHLTSKTICASAKHHTSSHYNLHSLYGHSEARTSNSILEKLYGHRSVVITRSSFPSTGHYAGHWLGDNISEWPDLQYSLSGILNFQLFGIPLVGADICGFRGETTPELCTRWMQAGAFYPFMRNHNALGSKDQDPAVFDQATQNAMKKAVSARYNLLPYLYTLFFYSHVNGSAVARPLMFEFPSENTYAIDQQFMWGDKLLISPVLTQGATFVSAFLPAGYWYDYYTGSQVRGQDTYTHLNAPLDVINLHIREGGIIPTQPANLTTTVARKQKYGLLVALTDMGQAEGELFLDDGYSIGTVESGNYSWFSFNVRNNTLTSSVKMSNYHPDTGILLGSCRIMGLKFSPNAVEANGKSVQFTFDSSRMVLDVRNLSLNMLSNINVRWSAGSL